MVQGERRRERVARDRGDQFLFALTTQAGDWFTEQGFAAATPEQVPPVRRAQQRERGSTGYVKRLA